MGKPKPPKKPPRWQTGIDNMTPWYAIALGPLTQPWALVAAGVTVIVEAKLSSWQDYLRLALFCVIATSAFLGPSMLAHAAHLENMRAEDLKPGQQPLQRLKISKLAVQHGLNRRHGNGEVSKVKQRLGRENPGNADLVMR
jgi:hypothetical protein